ncbi:MAG: hypothetical protein JWR10_4630 [Rubritepida sp.]|nr:hypothetical protein [Rubritepida sp.]
MPLLSLMRQGMILSLGWVVCAAVVLQYHGFLWALFVLAIWAVLVVRFQRATVAHAKSIAEARATTHPATPRS